MLSGFELYPRRVPLNKNKTSKEIHEGLSELFNFGLSLLLFIALLRFFSWLPLPPKTNSHEHVQTSSSDLLSACSVESKKDTKCYLFNIVVAFQTDRGIISSYARHICCSCFIPCR